LGSQDVSDIGQLERSKYGITKAPYYKYNQNSYLYLLR
jgi:hypothetical protein